MNMKENPMATRSKDSLTQALLELMEEMPYKDISISALTERAGLSRQAFYTNFTDKDAVLTRHMLELLSDILRQIEEQQVSTVERLVQVYTDIVEQNAVFFRQLAENELTGLVRRVFSRYLEALPPVLSCQRKTSLEDEQKFCNIFWIAGFIEVYATWLSEDMKTGRSEIEAILCGVMHGNYFPPRSGN